MPCIYISIPLYNVVQLYVTCPHDNFVLGSCPCSRASMKWLLSKEGTGNALVLVVGGATEALNAWPGSFNLQLKNRKGFVRMALKHGYVLGLISEYK